jgi:hypothetical protein
MTGYRFRFREIHHCHFCGRRISLHDDTTCFHCYANLKAITLVQTTCYRVMLRRRLYRQLRCGIPKGSVNIHIRAYPYEVYKYEFGIFGETLQGRSIVTYWPRSLDIKRSTEVKLVNNHAQIEGICGFQFVDKISGWGSSRILRRGDIAVICSPLVLVHRIAESGEHHLNLKVSWVVIRCNTGEISFDSNHPYEDTDYGSRDSQQCIINQVYNTAAKLREQGVTVPRHSYVPFNAVRRPRADAISGDPVRDTIDFTSITRRGTLDHTGAERVVINNDGANPVALRHPRRRHIRYAEGLEETDSELEEESAETYSRSQLSDDTYNPSDAEAGASSMSDDTDPSIDGQNEGMDDDQLSMHSSDYSAYAFARRARDLPARRGHY